MHNCVPQLVKTATIALCQTQQHYRLERRLTGRQTKHKTQLLHSHTEKQLINSTDNQTDTQPAIQTTRRTHNRPYRQPDGQTLPARRSLLTDVESYYTYNTRVND